MKGHMLSLIHSIFSWAETVSHDLRHLATVERIWRVSEVRWASWEKNPEKYYKIRAVERKNPHLPAFCFPFCFVESQEIVCVHTCVSECVCACVT